MKLLIIGGTGFFGKSILDCFINDKLTKYRINIIYVLSRSVEDFKINYPEFNTERIQYIKGDIATIDKLPYADIVIHAATSTNQNDYSQDSDKQKNNIEEGVLNYLLLAKKFHKTSKIVYCSSGAVYGKQPVELEKISEDFELGDISNLASLKRDYALGKRKAEQMISELGNIGLSVSIARCFAFYGKHLPKDQHFAYGNFLASAENGEDIIINSNHEVIRSYMHADDLVDSLLSIALDSSSSCPIYNVGSDIPVSIFELAYKIAKEYNVRVVKKPEIDSNLIDKYVPNTSKLQKLLND